MYVFCYFLLYDQFYIVFFVEFFFFQLFLGMLIFSPTIGCKHILPGADIVSICPLTF